MDRRFLRGLFEYLGTLPVESMIAAPPYLASDIPLFARRKVFIQYKLSHPFFDRYWETVKKRTYDFFDAYYAWDRRRVAEFCAKNGVDYLVVDRFSFRPDALARRAYFEPFGSYVRTLTAGRSRFALDELPESAASYSDGRMLVVGCGALGPPR